MLDKIFEGIKNLIGSGGMDGPKEFAPHPLYGKLSTLISEAKNAAEDALEANDEIEADLQSIVDTSNKLAPLVPHVPRQELEGLISAWSSARDQTIQLRDGLRGLGSDSDAAGGTVSLTGTSVTRVFSPSRFTTDDPDIREHLDQFNTYMQRPELRKEVRDLLAEFGFDEAVYPGDKSPLQLFQSAHEAYSKPVTSDNPSGTSLIPMRECIQSVIEGLISSRPTQEPAKSQRDKIKSIARQLRRSGITDDVIAQWADEWHELNKDDLSGAKRADIAREEWLSRLQRATLFLHSFLKGLDKSKMRQ